MSDEPEYEAVDAGDEKAIAKQKREIRKKLRLSGEFWKAIFADPVGRAEMWKLLQDTHAFEERFACGPTGFPQPESTWFQAGEQAFGLRLYQSWCMIDLPGVMAMHQEHDGRFQKPK